MGSGCFSTPLPHPCPSYSSLLFLLLLPCLCFVGGQSGVVFFFLAVPDTGLRSGACIAPPFFSLVSLDHFAFGLFVGPQGQVDAEALRFRPGLSSPSLGQ